MICYKCKCYVELPYKFAENGIPFYCKRCWEEIIKELEKEKRDA